MWDLTIIDREKKNVEIMGYTRPGYVKIAIENGHL
jgi:hypothetical protein